MDNTIYVIPGAEGKSLRLVFEETEYVAIGDFMKAMKDGLTEEQEEKLIELINNVTERNSVNEVSG